MEKVKVGLIHLFDDMLLHVKEFKRKTYVDVFEEGYERHKEVISDFIALCQNKSDEELESLISELATVIPDHAYEKLKALSKSKQNRLEVDYNMNVVVYVVPMITYTKDEYCKKLAEQLTAAWNAKGVSSLEIGQSSYEVIAGGFRKGILGFCYITTAVCENMNKADDCYELTTLRNYRDEYLMQTEEGRNLVEEYYDTAPFLVQVLDMQPNAKELYHDIYQDYLIPCIQYIEQNKNEECKERYINMVRGLQKKYLS